MKKEKEDLKKLEARTLDQKQLELEKAYKILLENRYKKIQLWK